MFGRTALDGYADQLRDLENRDRNYESVTSYYARLNAFMSSEEVFRVGAWINLLRHLTLATTPDVVAIYLIATAQDTLLRRFSKDSRERHSSYEPKHYDYEKRTWGCIADPCCCEGAYRFRAWDMEGPFMFPPELYKMATRYLKYRLERFVRTILEITQTEISKIRSGLSVTPSIKNAVSAYTITSEVVRSEIGNIIPNIQSLNATIRPEADDTLTDSGTRMDYSSTVYDGANPRDIRSRNHLEIVDKQFKNGLSVIAEDANRLGRYLLSSVETANVGEFNMIKDAFCDAAEAILCITASFRRGWRYGTGVHMPKIGSLGKFIFKEDANSSNRDVNGLKNGQDENVWIIASIYKRLTPAAALCLGEKLIEEAENGGGWHNSSIDEALDSVCPKQSDMDVLTYLWCEYSWSKSQWSIAQRIIERTRNRDEEGGPRR